MALGNITWMQKLFIVEEGSSLPSFATSTGLPIVAVILVSNFQ